jgi:histidine triad (HIT) family protein
LRETIKYQLQQGTKLKNWRENNKMITTCPFCNIVLGKAATSNVYEDAATIAFMDANPANIGHTLIVPKEHWENIYEIPENLLVEVTKVTKQVSIAVKKTVNADGISILQLNGKAAGQSVMHFHVHIIPRFRGDSIIGHRGFGSPERRELDEIAQKIRKNL